MVRDAGTESEVWWDNNGAITPEQFETLRQDFLKHAEGKELFAQDLYAAPIRPTGSRPGCSPSSRGTRCSSVTC